MKLAALCALVACERESTAVSPLSRPDPVPVPIVVDAAIADACETELRNLATRFGDPAPTLSRDFLRATRAEQLVCPKAADDVACEQLALSRVTLAQDETVTISISAVKEFAYYEFTYKLDGQRHTEHVADMASATKRLEQLAVGHAVTMESGERIEVPTGARVANAQITGAIDRVKRTAQIVAQLDNVPEAERPAYFERLTARIRGDLELESWKLAPERNVALVVASCVIPLQTH